MTSSVSSHPTFTLHKSTVKRRWYYSQPNQKIQSFILSPPWSEKSHYLTLKSTQSWKWHFSESWVGGTTHCMTPRISRNMSLKLGNDRQHCSCLTVRHHIPLGSIQAGVWRVLMLFLAQWFNLYLKSCVYQFVLNHWTENSMGSKNKEWKCFYGRVYIVTWMANNTSLSINHHIHSCYLIFRKAMRRKVL